MKRSQPRRCGHFSCFLSSPWRLRGRRVSRKQPGARNRQGHFLLPQSRSSPRAGTGGTITTTCLGPHRIKVAIVSVLLVVLLVFFFMISRGLTLFHKQFLPTTLLAHFVVSYLTYLHYKRSYIEINEQGITYQGMVRSIYSPWSGVRKISIYRNTSKIVTDNGNFSIGLVDLSTTRPEDGRPFPDQTAAVSQ